MNEAGTCLLGEPSILGNLTPAPAPADVPPVSLLPEPTAWLHSNALQPFLDEVRKERLEEVERIAAHVELSLTELLQKADEEIGRRRRRSKPRSAGLKAACRRPRPGTVELLTRRDRRRQELERQRSLSLQGVERLASVLILPHPEREAPEIRNLRSDPETEAVAMQFVMDHERALSRQVYDIHEKNLGYDIISLDLTTGELRLIEVKGIGAASGTVMLTPNERRVAEDRRDCYWLYVVTDCKARPTLHSVKDPAHLQWTEVVKVAHYRIDTQDLS